MPTTNDNTILNDFDTFSSITKQQTEDLYKKLRSIVQLPPGTNTNIWLAQHAENFFLLTEALYTAIESNAEINQSYDKVTFSASASASGATKENHINHHSILQAINTTLLSDEHFPREGRAYSDDFKSAIIIQLFFKPLALMLENVYHTHTQTLVDCRLKNHFNLMVNHFVCFSETFSLLEQHQLDSLKKVTPDQFENLKRPLTNNNHTKLIPANQSNRIVAEYYKHFEHQDQFIAEHSKPLAPNPRTFSLSRPRIRATRETLCQANEFIHQFYITLLTNPNKYIREQRTPPKKKIAISDYKLIQKIGKGGFGEVSIGYRKDDPERKIYAIKKISKEHIATNGKISHLFNERNFMADKSLNTPWNVKLHTSFQDTKHLYFVMDFCQGGDLMYRFIQKGVFDEETTRFVIAQLILAVLSSHKKNSVHRDLKPDNILFDAKNGQLKLADFGFVKKISSTPSLSPQNTPRIQAPESHKRRAKLHSKVGTLHYAAPEVLTGEGYDGSIDWWAIGIIMYEMLYGFVPFGTQEGYKFRNLTEQQQIIHFNETIEYPIDSRKTNQGENLPPVSDLAVDFLKQLLCAKQQRLGQDSMHYSEHVESTYGMSKIFNHLFFEGVDWNSLSERKGPFADESLAADDTSYFEFQDQDDHQYNIPNAQAHSTPKDIEHLSTLGTRYYGFTHRANTYTSNDNLNDTPCPSTRATPRLHLSVSAVANSNYTFFLNSNFSPLGSKHGTPRIPEQSSSSENNNRLQENNSQATSSKTSSNQFLDLFSRDNAKFSRDGSQQPSPRIPQRELEYIATKDMSIEQKIFSSSSNTAQKHDESRTPPNTTNLNSKAERHDLGHINNQPTQKNMESVPPLPLNKISFYQENNGKKINHGHPVTRDGASTSSVPLLREEKNQQCDDTAYQDSPQSSNKCVIQ